jgi:HSP20 family protein
VQQARCCCCADHGDRTKNAYPFAKSEKMRVRSEHKVSAVAPNLRCGKKLLAARKADVRVAKLSETSVGNEGKTMSTLSKWNPFKKSEELELWRPFARWDPSREMEDIMRSMQRALAQWPVRTGEAMALAEWSPSVDIGENDKEFIVKAELPDVKKEDIKVKVENRILSISGERKAEKEEKGVQFHRLERSYGRFERSFTLPDEADPDKITSEYKEGVLTIHLPKNPNVKTKARQITVQ